MSSYTMPLRAIIEKYTQDNPNLSHKERIEIGRQKLFDFDYPIFDENYRPIFETHFIRNFYMREIGFETEELFKFHLETWLNINMPYWNKMFESELIEYDPLTNTKMEVKRTVKTDTTQNQTSKTTGSSQGSATQNATGQLTDDNFNRRVESDTPDSRLYLTANDGEGVIEYASKIVEDSENNKRSTSTNQTSSSQENTSVSSDTDNQINEVEDYLQNRVGKIGVSSYAKLIMEYRESFLRIERQIFDEMNDLFMLVY